MPPEHRAAGRLRRLRPARRRRLHLARGQQLRAPRAGPAAGAPAARGVVTAGGARADRARARAALVRRRSRASCAAGGSSTRRRSRPDCTLALLELELRRRRARAVPAALPRAARTGQRRARAGRSRARGARCCAALRGLGAARDARRGASTSSSPAALPRGRRARAACAPSAASSPTARSCSASARSSRPTGASRPGESPELELLRFLAAHGFEHTPPPARLVPLRRRADHGDARHPAGLRPGRPRRLGVRARVVRRPRAVPGAAAPARRGHGTHAHRCSRARRAIRPSRPSRSAPRAPARASAIAPGRGARRCSAPCAPGGAAEPVRARADDVLARLRFLPPRRGRPGDPPARRLPPRAGAVGRRRLARARLRGRAGAPARASAAARARRCATSRACCARSPTPPRRCAAAARSRRRTGSAQARAAFLAGYDAGIDAALLPAGGEADARLLAACELEKALYELRYELDNRPHWAHVPVAGILRLLDG